MTSHSEVFISKYTNKEWGHNGSLYYTGSSGPQSTINYNKNYSACIQKFIREHRINTVADLGCGDFTCAKNMYDQLHVKYMGYDVYGDSQYNSIIGYNNRLCANTPAGKYSFKQMDIFAQREQLQYAELYILKNVLDYWTNEDIVTFMDYLTTNNKCKYLIVCVKYTDAKPDRTNVCGEQSPLCSQYYPLNKYKTTQLLTYNENAVYLITAANTDIKKVLVLQCENRTTLDYLGLTKRSLEYMINYSNMNENMSGYVYEYKYMNVDDRYCYLDGKPIHPACAKVNIIKEVLENTDAYYLVFLDSDAWINDIHRLHYLLKMMDSTSNSKYSNKHGAISRDPYRKRNTYINSGSFLLKVGDYTRNMYAELVEMMRRDDSHLTEWTYDQHYISQYIMEHKDDFIVFVPNIMNTPSGIILRHNWYKTHRLYTDLYNILDVLYQSVELNQPFTISELDVDGHIDTAPYPNIMEEANEYL
jgi:hypothetical protein